MDIRHLDWTAIVERHERTFARENHDRPVLHIRYPNGRPVAMPPAPPTVHEQWFNFDWRLDCFERQFDATDYLCEGFPTVWCNLGPDILAAFMGSEMRFENTFTSWVVHHVTDWTEEPALRFYRESWLWQEMERFLTLAAQRGAGRWLVGSGDLHTNADGLEALRGADHLLMDLLDQPEEIKKRLRECHEVYRQVLRAHLDTIHKWSPCNSSWMDAVCTGSYVIIQNDFSCMVGPEMFDEFFKEYVQKEAQEAERSIYHLDGPGALRHLESIAAAPDLDMIQWVPGAGAKPLPEWRTELLKIQSLGKGLWLNGTGREVIQMMEYLRPEGCIYRVDCDSREEADVVIKACERIYGCHVKREP